jgi:Mg-chelatase subunit ChlD
MKQRLFFFIMVCGVLPALFSAGSHAPYGAATGAAFELPYIVPPDQINIAQLIEQGNYGDSLPLTDALNVVCDADIRDDTAYLQVGLRGRSLMAMNIVFVIDKSRSMAEDDRLHWVKEALASFVERVGPDDMVSLVVFDDIARQLVAPAYLKTDAAKTQFMSRVNSILPSGGTNIYDGMAHGYQAVLVNQNLAHVNQIVCLTDGEHTATSKTQADMLALAAEHYAKGITISTIALGREADASLMADIAASGGGSTRFISDRNSMVASFGAGLESLVAPVARNISIEVRLASGVGLKETWGDHEVNRDVITYHLDSLASSDIKTLAVELVVDPQRVTQTPLATVSITYLDERNEPQHQGPYPVALGADALENFDRLSNPRIREAEGFITLGRGLVLLASEVDTINQLQAEYEQAVLQSRGAVPQPIKERLVRHLSGAIQELSLLQDYLSKIHDALINKPYSKELEILSASRLPFIRAYYLYVADT